MCSILTVPVKLVTDTGETTTVFKWLCSEHGLGYCTFSHKEEAEYYGLIHARKG